MGMRQMPTITDAEVIIRNQPKTKPPHRRSISPWTSPELGQSRGVPEDVDAATAQQHRARREQVENKKAPRAENAE